MHIEVHNHCFMHFGGVKTLFDLGAPPLLNAGYGARCFIPAVRLREEPAKNAISAFPQTTRWLTGEVRNATYAPGGRTERSRCPQNAWRTC